VSETIEHFYEETGAQTPGIGPKDLTAAVMRIGALI